MAKNCTIALGADHHGFNLKEWIKKSFVGKEKIIWEDCGAYDAERSDYPYFAQKVCHEIIKKNVSYGILLCGSGVGMAIAANRYKGIYAGLVWNAEIARRAHAEDNVNVLVLPADYLDTAQVSEIITAWLTTPFNEGRYAQRIAMLDKLI
jgi:ribose 5-phosphate isomerase B